MNFIFIVCEPILKFRKGYYWKGRSFSITLSDCCRWSSDHLYQTQQYMHSSFRITVNITLHRNHPSHLKENALTVRLCASYQSLIKTYIFISTYFITRSNCFFFFFFTWILLFFNSVPSQPLFRLPFDDLMLLSMKRVYFAFSMIFCMSKIWKQIIISFVRV